MLLEIDMFMNVICEIINYIILRSLQLTTYLYYNLLITYNLLNNKILVYKYILLLLLKKN